MSVLESLSRSSAGANACRRWRLGAVTSLLAMGGAVLSVPKGQTGVTSNATVTSAGFSYGYTTGTAPEADLEFAYALIEPDSWIAMGMMGGRSRETIEREIGPSDEPALWFSLRGRDYVVRDRALVIRAKDLVAPLQEFGARLRRLGRQQAALGTMQSELVRQQQQLAERVGADMRRLTAEALARGKADLVSGRARGVSQPPSNFRSPGFRPRPAIDV